MKNNYSMKCRIPTCMLTGIAMSLAGVAPVASAQPSAFEDSMRGTLSYAWFQSPVYTSSGLSGSVTADGFRVLDVIAGPVSGLGDARVWPQCALVRAIAPTHAFHASATLDWANTSTVTGAYQRLFLEVVDAAGCVIASIGRSADLGDQRGDDTAWAVLAWSPQCDGYVASQNLPQSHGFLSSVTVEAERGLGDNLVQLRWHRANGASGVMTPHPSAATATAVRISFWRWINGQIGSMTVHDVSFMGSCPADTDDGSGTGTRDGGVTIDDLLHYLSIFEQGLFAADMDDGSGTGTTDGGVTIDDLLYYLQRFEEGC